MSSSKACAVYARLRRTFERDGNLGNDGLVLDEQAGVARSVNGGNEIVTK